MYIYVYIYKYVYTYMYMYTYVYMYMYMYMYGIHGRGHHHNTHSSLLRKWVVLDWLSQNPRRLRSQSQCNHAWATVWVEDSQPQTL